MKNGISLVALIITIIVLIILTAAVVLTGVSTPQEAQLAVFYNNVSTVQEAVRLKMNSNLITYASKGTSNLLKYKWVKVVKEYTVENIQNGQSPIFNDRTINGKSVAKIDDEIKKNVTMSSDEFSKYYVDSDGIVYYEGFLYDGVIHYNQTITSNNRAPSIVPPLVPELPDVPWEDEIASRFDGGTGTSSDPYEIANANQFALLSYINMNQIGLTNPSPDDLQERTYEYLKYAYYELTSDIKMNEGDFVKQSGSWYYKKTDNTMIALSNLTGDDAYAWECADFYGTFYGNNHTIESLYLNTASGLFGVVYGYIECLGVINSCIYTSEGGPAILAGHVYTGGVLNKCYTEGGYAYTSNSWGVGCLAGGVTGGGQIYNSYANTDFYATARGGMLGTGIQNGRVVNCYNRGNINGRLSCGGVGDCIGYGSTWSTSFLHNYYNTGIVSVSSRPGFVFGCGFGGTVSHLYSTNGSAFGAFEGSPSQSYISSFTHSGLTNTLSTSVYGTTDLLTALNGYVSQYKNSFPIELCNWKADTNNVNDGYPMFDWQ